MSLYLRNRAKLYRKRHQTTLKLLQTRVCKKIHFILRIYADSQRLPSSSVNVYLRLGCVFAKAAVFADDFDAAALQIVDDDLSVALLFDTHVVAPVHSAFDAFVHSTVDLRQVVAFSRCNENH